MNILLTGVGRRVELLQAFRNAALVLNKELKLYGADTVTTAPALVYCDCVRQVVGMRDPSYIDNLIEICMTDRIDLLIPTIDTDLLVLSMNRQRFQDIGTRVMVSDPEMIRVCRDKNNTAGFFSDCGLSAPVTVNDWEAYNSGFPAFIKPKDGSSAINAFKVNNREQLKIYAEEIKDYIVQPFIEGKEYTIDIFCDWDGRPISIIPRERIQVRGGEVLKTRITMDRAMVDEGKRLCKAFHPCGAITVQLIRDANGVDWFIEINPRFGGGAPLSMKAGAKSAEAILKLLDGEAVEAVTKIADGAVYSRFDQSVCIEQGHGAVKGVIFDLDDTLYPEKEYIGSGFKAVSDYLGGGCEERLWDFFNAGEPAIDALLKEMGRENEKEKALSVYRLHKPNIRLYPGVLEMIEALKAKNIRVGIITDGRREGQRKKLEALGLNAETIITDELGGPQFRKPCDIAFRIMAARWRLPYEQIVYVGDNPAKDFQAPKQLGMKSIYFMNPDGLYTDASGNGLRTIAEIREKILGM